MKNKQVIHRITFTVVVDFPVNPTYYPEATTDEERLAADISNANEDPFSMLSDDAKWTIVGEIIKEQE